MEKEHTERKEEGPLKIKRAIKRVRNLRDIKMPWRAKGREVQKKSGGKWIHHAWAKSAASAKRMVKLLYSKEKK